MAEIYRAAASLMLFRPSRTDGGSYELLLLHKPRKRDAWQLPQGGAEGSESIEETAVRELSEEAGLTRVEVLGTSEEVYQYDFPPSYRRFRPDNVKGQRIAYVFAFTDGAQEVRVDGKEVDKYAWIDPSQLHRYVHRREYLGLLRRLLTEGAERLRARTGR